MEKEIPSFQDIILRLQSYWASKGCAILQPYDLEMGAGTFHPGTTFRILRKKPWNVIFVQPSRRPTDGRYGLHPNRLQHYYQMQVLLKPYPKNVKELYLESLSLIGLEIERRDIRFVEDDWESPTLGAAGLGWEVWCDGMEITQFTYMKQIGGIELGQIPCEITYGLERIALYVQSKDRIEDIDWGGRLTYGEIDFEAEKQFSEYNFKIADTKMLFRLFEDYEKESSSLIEKGLPVPAYDYCVKAGHVFNLLNARGVIGVTERALYISRVRRMAKEVCALYLKVCPD